jgi:urocanate hydratase
VTIDPQLQTLHTYTALAALRPDWPGSLILSVGLSPEAQPMAFAAIIAGAAILSVEPSPDHCRAATRTGACDFLVNTVDESLRILKNEVRQRKPISVALQLDSAAALAELAERGVLPQLFLGPDGSGPFHAESTSLPENAEAVAAAHGWQQQSFAFESSAALRAFDARLQALIPAQDPRHRWVTSAPRLFPRDRNRHFFLTEAERAILSLALQDPPDAPAFR